MLRHTNVQAKPDIRRIVDDLLAEESQYDNVESRSTHREHLVRAVGIDIRDIEAKIDGFSKNISATGMGVITSVAIAEKSVATLSIAKLKGSTTSIVSECRWCKPYGENWFLSGWQFIAVKRAPLSRRR